MKFEQIKNRVVDKVKNFYSNKREMSYQIIDNIKNRSTNMKKQEIIDNFDAFICAGNPKVVKYIKTQFDFAEIEKSIFDMESEEDKIIAIKLLKDEVLDYSIIDIMNSFNNETNIFL